MKTKKSGAAKRARATALHKRSVRQRPIHKRVLLHPFTAFVLLCVGVLVAGSTIRGGAETFDVTATVPAPSLSERAIITQPNNQQHVTAQPITVGGTCPAASYVKLYRDGAFSGTALCDDGTFDIRTSLSLGANELRARIFNLTDQEGPDSSPITVYYDLPTAITPPKSLPTKLQLSNVDRDGYDQGAVQEVGSNPTLSGLAPPYSDVTVTFYSIPSVCKTRADGRGVWSCTLANALAPGLHHVVITATTPSGEKLTFPTFEIKVVQHASPLAITSDYRYQVHRRGQSTNWKLAISGGVAPYTLLVDWGDGSTERIVRQNQSEFDISHTYTSPAAAKSYTVQITAKDAQGTTTVLQLAAALRGAAVPVSAGRSSWAALAANVQQWLWVVWPVYIAVVLMALSFWIGEREAYQRFVIQRRFGKPKPSGGRRF